MDKDEISFCVLRVYESLKIAPINKDFEKRKN